MPQNIITGTRLADRIIALGWQVREVAEGSGVNRWALNDYFKGKPITPMHLARLAKFLHCAPETLVG